MRILIKQTKKEIQEAKRLHAIKVKSARHIINTLGEDVISWHGKQIILDFIK